MSATFRFSRFRFQSCYDKQYQSWRSRDSTSANRSSQTKVAKSGKLADLSKQASSGTDIQATNAPVWRATAVAAKLNQLNLDNVDASKITVSWKAGRDSANPRRGERYLSQR